MCIGTVVSKVVESEYTVVDECIKDMKLVAANCELYWTTLNARKQTPISQDHVCRPSASDKRPPDEKIMFSYLFTTNYAVDSYQ